MKKGALADAGSCCSSWFKRCSTILGPELVVSRLFSGPRGPAAWSSCRPGRPCPADVPRGRPAAAVGCGSRNSFAAWHGSRTRSSSRAGRSTHVPVNSVGCTSNRAASPATVCRPLAFPAPLSPWTRPRRASSLQSLPSTLRPNVRRS